MDPGPLQQAQLLPETSQFPACTVSWDSLSPATVFTETPLESDLHFILNKRQLRDAKTGTCKCSKSKNSKQGSFLMEESLLDTASCQTRKKQ